MSFPFSLCFISWLVRCGRLTILSPCFRLFSDQGMTFAFDNRAKSGFSRGEGVGVMVLKSQAAAVRDNDRIRSVIVSSGVGQDGRTVGKYLLRLTTPVTTKLIANTFALFTGITSPSGEAQETLIREVYNRAGISPKDVGYVEAHGT